MPANLLQRPLFADTSEGLDSSLWAGSFNAFESSLHQLAPYVGKLKSGMVRVLVELYSKSGDTILDPFSGSGVVPLEATLLGRNTVANDLSTYAYVLTRAKLEAPDSLILALKDAEDLLSIVERERESVDLTSAPEWVRGFFHPKTLQEIIVAFRVLRKSEHHFLMGCLLGILHHQRPGFLSFPASHLTPYMRENNFPRDRYPLLYEYRDLRSRLIAKIRRAYRRTFFTEVRNGTQWKVLNTNSMKLPIEAASIDAIISSPPYFGALDYARDNRLRLWFLGVPDWKALDKDLTASEKVYIPQMTECLREMDRVLKPDKYCVLVLGDVTRNGKHRPTAEIVSKLANEVSAGRLSEERIYTDEIPDLRRSRRRTKTTKYERILIMRKA